MRASNFASASRTGISTRVSVACRRSRKRDRGCRSRNPAASRARPRAVREDDQDRLPDVALVLRHARRRRCRGSSCTGNAQPRPSKSFCSSSAGLIRSTPSARPAAIGFGPPGFDDQVALPRGRQAADQHRRAAQRHDSADVRLQSVHQRARMEVGAGAPRRPAGDQHRRARRARARAACRGRSCRRAVQQACPIAASVDAHERALDRQRRRSP